MNDATSHSRPQRASTLGVDYKLTISCFGTSGSIGIILSHPDGRQLGTQGLVPGSSAQKIGTPSVTDLQSVTLHPITGIELFVDGGMTQV